MKLYKVANNSISQQLAKTYDIAILQEALNMAQQYGNQEKRQDSNQYGFEVGQKLTYTKKSGYRGGCTVEEVNSDGTLLVLDNSGRRMGKSGGDGFKPVQMGINMFEEMS